MKLFEELAVLLETDPINLIYSQYPLTFEKGAGMGVLLETDPINFIYSKYPLTFERRAGLGKSKWQAPFTSSQSRNYHVDSHSSISDNYNITKPLGMN